MSPSSPNDPKKVLIRTRIGMEQVHYAGNLVDGAFMLKLFGDVATELLIRHDGHEGLFRAYDSVEFLSPVQAGDYIEATGWITSLGNTSRTMAFEAHKVISLTNNPDDPGQARLLQEPILVCQASGTCVVPLESQRKQ